MGPHGELFLSKHSPFTLVSDLGVTTDSVGGHVTTNCPCCSSKMYVMQHDFLCSNTICDFRAGNAAAYMSFVDGHRDISRAADTLQQLSGQKGSVLREVKYDLKEDRELFLFFTSAILNQKIERTKIRVQAEGWLRKQGHDPANTTKASILVTAKEIAVLNKILDKKEILPVMPGHQGFLLLIPYFSSYSSVGAILVIRPGSSESRFINLSPEKFMWAGLMEASAPADKCLITQNFALLMRLCSSKRYTLMGTPIGMKYNSRGAESKIVPNNSVYLHYPELEPNMAAVSSMFEATHSNKIQEFSKGISRDHQKTWSSYIVPFLKTKIEESDNVDNVMLHYIDSCKLSFADKERLLNEVLFSGQPLKAGQLKQHFSTRIIHISDKHQIRQAPAGYFAQEQKSGYRTEITNFTLGVERNIIFPEKKEIVTECRAQFGSSSTLVHIPTSQLDNPVKVEECVRSVWLSTAGESDSTLPLVKDKNLYRKYVSTYLKEEAGRVPSLEGISAIGWNHNRTRFTGPGWVVDEDGMRKSKSVIHREIDFLNMYNEVVPTCTNKVPKGLNIEVRDTVAMLAANLLRGGLSLKNHSVAFKNTPESRKLLGCVFAALNQTTPYLAHRRSVEVAGCRGYPFMAGEVHDSVARTNIPMFYLNNEVGDDGLYLEPNEEALLVPFVAGIVKQILLKFFDGDFSAFRPVRSVDTNNLLKQEGSQILTSVLGKKWEVSPSPCDTTDTFLSSIPVNKLSDVFLLDIVNQGVTVEAGKNGVDNNVLSTIANRVPLQDVDGHRYRFNMVGMSDLLSVYYQTSSIQFGRI